MVIQALLAVRRSTVAHRISPLTHAMLWCAARTLESSACPVIIEIPVDEIPHTCLYRRVGTISDIVNERFDIGPGIRDVARLQRQQVQVALADSLMCGAPFLLKQQPLPADWHRATTP